MLIASGEEEEGAKKLEELLEGYVKSAEGDDDER